MAERANKYANLRPFVVMLSAAVLVALPVVASYLGASYVSVDFRRFLIFAIAAVSLDVILGYGGMVSLGHAAFFGLGAYTVGLLHLAATALGWPVFLTDPLLSWIAGALVAAVVAFFVGAISLRTSGVYFIMITLAFAQLVYFVFIGLKGVGGDEGLRFAVNRNLLGFVDLSDRVVFYYVVLFALGVSLFFCQRLINSHFGMVIQGCRDNERRMRALGYETYIYRLACFIIAGALAGFAGGLFATHESFVSPSLMHWSRSGEFIVMVVLGGLGTLYGPVIGAILFLWLESFLPEYHEHWMAFFGLVLIVVIAFAKRGLFGSLPSPVGGRSRA